MSMIVRLLLLAVAVAAQASAVTSTTTFNNVGGDGLWSNAANWDQGLPGNILTNVVIPAGSTVTLDFDSTAEAYNLVHLGGTLNITNNGVLSGPGVVNETGAFFLFTATLELDSGGVVNLQGGTLAYIDVVTGLGAGAVVAYNPGTFLNALNNVIIDTGIVLDLSQQPGAFCTLVQGIIPDPENPSNTISMGGLTVNGSVLIGSQDGAIAASLYCQGSSMLTGTGTITFGGSTQNAITELTPGSTLTIGNALESATPLVVRGINGTVSALGTVNGTPTTLVVAPGGAIISNGGMINGGSDGTPNGTINLNVASWAIDGCVGTQSGDALVLSATGSGAFDGSHASATSVDSQAGTLNFPALFTNGGALTISGGSWTYSGNGLLSANNGILTLGGSWFSNQNMLGSGYSFFPAILGSNSIINLGGLFYSTDAESLANQSFGTTINIVGVMDNAPGDNTSLYQVTAGPAASGLDLLSADDNLTWNLAGGTIVGGALYDGTLHATDSGGTLNGVTIDDPLVGLDPPTLAPGILAIDTSLTGGTPTCTCTGSLTVNGSVLIGSSGGEIAGTLVWQGSQTWSGSGEIAFSNNYYNAINEYAPNNLPLNQLNATLTIGPQLLIDGVQGFITANAGNASMLINQGTINAQGNSIYLELANWINLGTLSAASGSSLVINATGTGSNQQGVVAINGIATPVSGLITSNGGSISFVGGGSWSTTIVQGVLIQDGSLSIGAVNDLTTGKQGISLLNPGNASTVALILTGGTTAEAMSILARSSNVTSVTITGPLDNSAGTLDLGGGAGPGWFLGSGGQISGGDIADGTLTVNATSGAFLTGGVAIDAGATLIIDDFSSCTVLGNLIIDGTVQLGNLNGESQFNWDPQFGTQTWGGGGRITTLGSGNSLHDVGTQASEGEPGLLFGDGALALTLAIVDGSVTLATSNNHGFTISSKAVISSDHALLILSGAQTFTNNGKLSAFDMGTITGNLTDTSVINNGSMTVGKSGDGFPSNLRFDMGSFTNAGKISSAAASSAYLDTQFDLTNQAGGTISTTEPGDIVTLMDEGFPFTNDGAISAAPSSTLVLRGAITNDGMVTIDHATFMIDGTWTNDPNSDFPGTMAGTASHFFLGGSYNVDEFNAIALTSAAPGDCAIHLVGSLFGTLASNPTTAGVLDLSFKDYTVTPANPPSWFLDGGSLNTLTLSDSSDSGLALVVTTANAPINIGGTGGSYPGALSLVTVGTSTHNTVLLDLASYNNASCSVSIGLTVNSAILLGGTTNSEGYNNASLTWIGTQNWSGQGAIDFGFATNDAITDGNGFSNGNVLTTSLTINAGAGTIAANSPGAVLVNSGTITDLGGLPGNLVAASNSFYSMTIQLGGNNTFLNNGLLSVVEGSNIQVDGDYAQTGTLAVAYGTPNDPPVPIAATPNALVVSGNAALAGIISLSQVTGFSSQPDPYVVVVSGGPLSGTFSSTAGSMPSTYALAYGPNLAMVQPATITITSPATSTASPIAFLVTASTPICLPLAPPVVGNGTLSGVTYPTSFGAAAPTFTINVIPNGTGAVTLSIPAGVAVDAAGVGTLASNISATVFDNTPLDATITPNGISTNNPSIAFTISFSNPLASLATGTITAIGGSVTSVNQGLSSSQWIAHVTATGSGSPATPVTLQVPAAAATDQVGQHLAASASATVTFDTAAPTVVISPNGTFTNTSPIPFTLTFSKPVALTTLGLTTTGTLGALSGGPIVWTVPVTAGPGSASLTVHGLASSVDAPVDLAGNALAVDAVAAVTVDTIPPTVLSFTPTGTTTNASPITFTIGFSETVSLNIGLLQVTGGTLVGVSAGPGATYTITVTPSTVNPPVLVSVTVPGAAVADLAGNAMAQPASTSVTFDNSALTTVITPSGTAQASPPIVFTVTFGRPPVADLTLGEVTITNGSASAVATVSPGVYTIAVTPVATGAVFLQIAGGVVVDAAGNPNQPAIAVVNFSTNAPSVVVTPVSGTSALSPVTFTLTFSTAVTGLNSGGLASNGTLGAITPVGGGGTTYTVAVTPPGFGTVTLQVLASAAVDGSDHGNTTSNIGSIDYTVVTASTPVTVTVAPAAPTANTSPVVFTLTFSVPVIGLTIGDLVITNGTASNLQGSGASYTVDVTPNGDGPVSVAVLPDVATDSAGTGNLASPPATVVYHHTPPSAALAFALNVPVAALSFPLSISFSEPVTGFTLGGLNIANGTASAFTVSDASHYSVTITPAQPVTASVIVTVPGASCQDAFGNANLAATITIPMQSGQVSSGVVTPTIALSPATSTVFSAICPGTQGGLAQVETFLSGASSAQARAFVWDATLQDFVQVPGQSPTGGWQPFQGIFLATRLATAFDFNGFMTTFDFTLTLKPGWNFVGIPPLDDNGTAVTTHLWSDLQLEDTTGAIISGPERVGLIDVGAWGWNGSAYTQISGALATGQGYWIDNASSPGVDLVLRRLSPSELSAQLGAYRAAQSGRSQSSQAAAATIGYKAHGTPPQPPGGASQNDSPGHGCGLGSGLGALLTGLALLLRLRLRSRR